MQDKRSKQRIDINIAADLKNLEAMAGQTESTEIDDFSYDGLFICTQEPYKNGTPLEIVLHFPSEAGKPATHLTLTCEVVWCGQKVRQSDRKIVSGVGVRFTQMNADTFEQVIALYERMNRRTN